MGDEGSSRRSYLFTMDTEGRWHSSSILDRASSSVSGRDRPSKNKKNAPKIRTIDRRTWIWSGGWNSSEIFTCGFSYVALQGNDTMCVVTGDKKIVKKRKNHVWMDHLITEIKANGLYGFGKRDSGKYKGMVPDDEDLRPYAAVNVVLGTKEDNAESGDGTSGIELNEKEVIDVLMRKVQEGSGFSYEETIQTALSALQRLLKMELMAREVKVCIWKKGMSGVVHLLANEIEEHLEVIRKQELDAHHCCQYVMTSDIIYPFED